MKFITPLQTELSALSENKDCFNGIVPGKSFLKIHWKSLFALVFMTLDSLFGKKFYLLIIPELKNRKIVRFDLTENPYREFVKQRIELFSEDFEEKKTLIFDSSLQFTSIDYSWYGIKGVNICTSAPKAGRKQAFCSPMLPGMNAYVERLNGTIRREALDHFLLFSRKQIRNIVSKFIEYYNTKRIHQGIDKIPDAKIHENSGSIRKIQILSGLHHHYYRSSA